MLTAATGGAFDHLMNHNVEQAVRDLLARMKKHHEALVKKLDEGTKPEDGEVKTIVEEAQKVAATFKKEEDVSK